MLNLLFLHFNIVWCGISCDYNQILISVPVSKCVSECASNYGQIRRTQWHSRSAATCRRLCIYCVHISVHVRLFDKLNVKLKFIWFANLYNKISISSVRFKKSPAIKHVAHTNTFCSFGCYQLIQGISILTLRVGSLQNTTRRGVMLPHFLSP